MVSVSLKYVNYYDQAEPEAACHSKFRPSEARKERRMRPAPTTDDIGSVHRVTTRYTREPLGRLTQAANLSPKRSGPGREPTLYAAFTNAADYSDMCLPTSYFHALILPLAKLGLGMGESLCRVFLRQLKQAASNPVSSM